MTAHTILTARLGPREYLVQVWPDHAEISTRNYGSTSWGPPTTMRRQPNPDAELAAWVAPALTDGDGLAGRIEAASRRQTGEAS